MNDSRDGLELVASQLESLQQLTAAFSTSVTTEHVTSELVRHATESMDAAVWVVFIDESGQGLNTAATVGYGPDVVASHQRIPIDASLPLAQIARTGQPLWYPDAQEAFARWPRLREITADAVDVASIAFVPLDGGDQHPGAISLCFPQPRVLSATDRNYLLTLGRVSGQALRRARQYDSEHTIATALQRALLPELPDLATADVSARYHPAAGAQVGGDWYDVIPLPKGRVGVVVGDVAGHNIDAAAVMGQMRATLRALAVSEQDPGKVITRLNAMAGDFSRVVMTTLFFGVWYSNGTLGYVAAGHPPPAVRAPSGGVRVLYGAPPSAPVNVDPNTTYTTASVELKPGEILLAYTDGLIERRTESIDAGIARLTHALESTPHDDLDDICDDIRHRLQTHKQEDDTVLLALRLLQTGRLSGS